MNDDTPLKWCSDCGKFHALEAFELPDVRPSHFSEARKIADALWEVLTLKHERREAITIAALTAALLTKRTAVTLGLGIGSVLGVAGMYLEIAHEIIAARRRAAAAGPKDVN